MTEIDIDMLDNLQAQFIRRYLESLAQATLEGCSNVSGHTQELVFHLVDGQIINVDIHYRTFGSSVLSSRQVNLP